MTVSTTAMRVRDTWFLSTTSTLMPCRNGYFMLSAIWQQQAEEARSIPPCVFLPRDFREQLSPHTALHGPKLAGRHLWEGTHGSEFIGGGQGAASPTQDSFHIFTVFKG